MAAVLSFLFYKAVLNLQQSDSVNIHHWILNVKCCITPVWGSWKSVLLFQVRRVRGTAQNSVLGLAWYPLEHSWTTLNADCIVSSWSPSRSVFLSPKLWCVCRLLEIYFQVSSLFPFLNAVEFSKWEIIFHFSRQICCYSSRLSDIAGAYNKCLLQLMEIKLLGANLARGIKN